MSGSVVMRTLPTLDKGTKKETPGDLSQLVAIGILVYFVLNTFSRVVARNGSTFDTLICFATPICLVIYIIWETKTAKQKNIQIQGERQQWKDACKSAEVAIVNRRCNRGGVYEDGYNPGEFHTIRSYYHLELAANADQRAVIPDQTIVDVEVSQGVYDGLEKRDTVRIYYKPEKPFTFLLEDEI
jgi:hypothetical protein